MGPEFDMPRLHTGRRRPLRAALRDFATATGASTAVEFAFIAPVLFALLLAMTQIAVIFIAESYIQTVAETTERQILTNQYTSLTADQIRAQVCSNVSALFSNCASNMIISLQAAPSTPAGIAAAMPTFDSNGNLTSVPPIQTISQNTQALLIIMYKWPVIAGPLGAVFGSLADGTYLLTATEVFQTEPCTKTTGC